MNWRATATMSNGESLTVELFASHVVIAAEQAYAMFYRRNGYQRGFQVESLVRVAA